MGDETVTGDERLRGSGIGSILGGIFLVVMAIFLPYAPAAAVILLGGLFQMWTERRKEQATSVGVGVTAVGGIALLEALVPAVGLGPFLLGGFAVVAGAFDIVLGFVFGSLRDRNG